MPCQPSPKSPHLHPGMPAGAVQQGSFHWKFPCRKQPSALNGRMGNANKNGLRILGISPALIGTAYLIGVYTWVSPHASKHIGSPKLSGPLADEASSVLRGLLSEATHSRCSHHSHASKNHSVGNHPFSAISKTTTKPGFGIGSFY